MFELYMEYAENPRACHKVGRDLALKTAKEKLALTPNIQIGENGKPYIDGLYFNISHSENLVVCAFGDGEIGVDVEKIKPLRPRVLKRFHPTEIEYIEASDDKDLAFYKIWTMKEAYLKCLGIGITKELSSFCVFDIPNMHTEIKDNYIISICEK